MPSFKRLPQLAAWTVLASLSTAALAEPIVSAGYALTSTKYDDVKDGNGYNATLGYEFERIPFFFEAEYYKSGDLDYKFSPGDGVEYDGFQGFIGYDLIAGPLRLMLKGGYYGLDAKSPFGSSKEKGFSAGIGIDWLFSRDFGLRFDIETPFKVDPAPGVPTDETTQLSIIKLGFVWRPSFEHSTPSSGEPGKVLASPTLPAPVQAGPVARAGSVLRQRPSASAPVVGKVGAEEALTLQQGVSNNEGKWWLANRSAGSGWIADGDLISH